MVSASMASANEKRSSDVSTFVNLFFALRRSLIGKRSARMGVAQYAPSVYVTRLWVGAIGSCGVAVGGSCSALSKMRRILYVVVRSAGTRPVERIRTRN